MGCTLGINDVFQCVAAIEHIPIAIGVVPVLVHLGGEALNLFKDLPAEGPLFPYLSRVRAGDRATEFKQRCQQLKITGVTLHSYRYAWAERAKTVG